MTRSTHQPRIARSRLPGIGDRTEITTLDGSQVSVVERLDGATDLQIGTAVRRASPPPTPARWVPSWPAPSASTPSCSRTWAQCWAASRSTPFGWPYRSPHRAHHRRARDPCPQPGHRRGRPAGQPGRRRPGPGHRAGRRLPGRRDRPSRRHRGLPGPGGGRSWVLTPLCSPAAPATSSWSSGSPSCWPGCSPAPAGTSGSPPSRSSWPPASSSAPTPPARCSSNTLRTSSCWPPSG